MCIYVCEVASVEICIYVYAVRIHLPCFGQNVRLLTLACKVCQLKTQHCPLMVEHSALVGRKRSQHMCDGIRKCKYHKRHRVIVTAA